MTDKNRIRHLLQAFFEAIGFHSIFDRIFPLKETETLLCNRKKKWIKN